MKRIVACMIFIAALCCTTGTAFGRSDHGRGHYENRGHRSGYHHNDYHHGHHGGTSWSVGFYAPAVIVAPPPPVYYPVVQCRYIDVFDAWGNYRGREQVCQ